MSTSPIPVGSSRRPSTPKDASQTEDTSSLSSDNPPATDESETTTTQERAQPSTDNVTGTPSDTEGTSAANPSSEDDADGETDGEEDTEPELTPEQLDQIQYLTGFRQFRYGFHRVTNRPTAIPKLNAKQQLARDEAHAAEEKARDEAREAAEKVSDDTWIREVSEIMPLRVAALQNAGGGGKTTSLGMAADYVCKVTGGVVRMVPASRNASAMAMQMGVRDIETLSLTDLVANRDGFRTFRSVSLAERKNYHYVRIIGNPRRSKDLDLLERSIYEEVMYILDSECDFLGMDGGNQLGELGFERSAAKIADVLLFPCMAGDLKSVACQGWTIDDLLDCPEEVDMLKMQNAVAVVNGVVPGQDLAQYREYLSTILDEHGKVVGERDMKGTLMGLPWDPYLTPDPKVLQMEKIAIVLDKLSPELLKAVRKLVIQLYQAAALYRKVDLSAFDHLLTASAAAPN